MFRILQYSSSGSETCQPQNEILNLEGPRAGKSSEKWVKVVKCPKFPSGRTFSGDYGYWKSLYRFKAKAVNITINFTI